MIEILEENYLVEKSNVLNEMRVKSMSMQELRFLSIYLSKINSRDESSREVAFPLDEFKKIMDLGRLNLNQIENTFDGLLQKIVKLPFEDEKQIGFSKIQLFKKCKLLKDKDTGEYIVIISAHDEVLPYMFDLQGKYFKYKLWNCLRLKSTNQIRLYEILKQYEKIKTRTIPISDLKELLGLRQDEYSIWQNFKVRVLESCKNSLKQYTDIYFDYEPVKKGRKFFAVKFIIHQNKNFNDQLKLNQFINPSLIEENEIENKDDSSEIISTVKSNQMQLLSEATNNEFNDIEMEVIFHTISTFAIKEVMGSIELGRYHFLALKYAELNKRASVDSISNRFAYFLKMIQDNN